MVEQAKHAQLHEGCSRHSRSRAEALTPRQRLRQLEPSWLRNGQTTSLLASETEKEEVSDERGGIVVVEPMNAKRGVDRLDSGIAIGGELNCCDKIRSCARSWSDVKLTIKTMAA